MDGLVQGRCFRPLAGLVGSRNCKQKLQRCRLGVMHATGGRRRQLEKKGRVRWRWCGLDKALPSSAKELTQEHVC